MREGLVSETNKRFPGSSGTTRRWFESYRILVGTFREGITVVQRREIDGGNVFSLRLVTQRILRHGRTGFVVVLCCLGFTYLPVVDNGTISVYS